jgi:hypothetical protein
VIVVFARAGREALTARTLGLLDQAGAAGRPRALWWSGPTSPVVPDGWRVEARSTPGGSVADWFAFIARAKGVGDLHVFEDDVIPCRNLIPYVERAPVRWFTSYFNPWGAPVGEACALGGALGWDCSQAFSVPRRLVDRMAAGPDLGEVGTLGHDCIMARLLKRWREPVLWDRTLVQHEKGDSANGQRRTFWLRDAKWVGPDFDALKLPTRAAATAIRHGARFVGATPTVDQRGERRPPRW